MERADLLRKRIATYRRCLTVKNDIVFARLLLAEILNDESELRRIEQVLAERDE